MKPGFQSDFREADAVAAAVAAIAKLPFRVDLREVIEQVSRLAFVARVAKDPEVDDACDRLLRLMVPRYAASLA